MSYGKYKGELFEEIYKKDKKYLLWCIENNPKQKHDIELFLDTICTGIKIEFEIQSQILFCLL